MSSRFTYALAPALLFSGVAAFFLVGFLPIAHAGMDMTTGQMTNCFFMSEEARVCIMNPLEHITAWQGMFAATFDKGLFATILYLLSILALAVTVRPLSYAKIADPPRHVLISYFPNDYRGENPMRELFSSGILNPKTYSCGNIFFLMS